MKRAAALVVLALSLAASPLAVTTGGGTEKTGPGTWALYTPSEVPWRDGPESLPAGAKVAVLEGDPSKDGFFTMRLLLPDGYRVAPHWHPKVERLTIISGTLNLGTGDRFDAAATKALPAGTYSSMPPKMTHFAWATGETMLQLSSIGPWQVIYVDPSDDPRKTLSPGSARDRAFRPLPSFPRDRPRPASVRIPAGTAPLRRRSGDASVNQALPRGLEQTLSRASTCCR